MGSSSYKWTFAFFFLMLWVTTACYVVAATDAFGLRSFAIVTLVGCIVVILRAMFNVVMYDRNLEASRSRGVPLAGTASVTCPDFWTRVTNEATGASQCVNTFVGDGSTIGDTAIRTKNLGAPTADMTDDAWTTTFCNTVKSDVADFPRTGPSKFCEYLARK